MMRLAIKSGASPVASDRKFHLILAEISGNAVLKRVVADLFDSRHHPLHQDITSYIDATPNWQMAVEEHESILLALKKRDSTLAQLAIRNHIDASGQRWLNFSVT